MSDMPTTGPDASVPEPASTGNTGLPDTIIVGSAGVAPTAFPHAAPLASWAGIPRKLGPYELVSELGHGGMGVVFRARHVKLGSDCAVKVLIAGEHASPEAIARFQREAAAVARMGKHPNIVTVHDLGEEGTLSYYSMELVAGETLRRLLTTRPYGPNEAAALLAKVARALHFAHEHGVIHRDIKPENIVVREDGEPQVMDFGLARDVGAGQNLSITGQLMGTPAYMAPEQARGELSKTDGRTDVYALGATLYEMLTGIPPHAGDDLAQIFNRILQGDTVAPRQLRAGVPRDLETVCLKCLEVDPARRYATAAELAEDLARCVRGDPVRARRASLAERAWRRAVRHRAVVVPSAFAVLMALGFGVYAVVTHFQRVDDQAQRQRELELAYAKVRGALDQAERALAGERAMGSALQKSYAVSTVLERWAGLTEPIEAMESAFYDSTLTPAEVRNRNRSSWSKVLEFLDEPSDDGAVRVTKLALAGWARALAGHDEEAQDWMRTASLRDPDIPYGALMRAMLLFCRNVDELPFPPIHVGRDGTLTFGAMPAESEAARARGEEVTRLLSEARHARIWGREGAWEYQGALEAMLAMQEERYADAEKGLTRAIEGRELVPIRGSLLLARGKVRYLLLDLDAAAEDLTEVLRRRPRHALTWSVLGLVHAGEGATCAGAGGDPRPSYRQAIADLDQALKFNPSNAGTHNIRGSTYQSLGEAEAARGTDPREVYEKALADYDEAVAHDPEMVIAYTNRGNLKVILGKAKAGPGEDPRPWYQKAIEDYDDALRRDPEHGVAYTFRANAYRFLGDAEDEHGADPRASYESGLRDCDESLRRDSRQAPVYHLRGLLHTWLGRARQARGEDPRVNYESAIASLGDAIALGAPSAELYLDRGKAHSCLVEAEEGSGVDRRRTCEKAIADYEEALRRDPRLWVAHSNLGLMHETLGAPATAVKEYEAALSLMGGKDPLIESWLARARAAAAKSPRR